MSLNDKKISNSFGDLLQVDSSNNGVGTSLVNVKDGKGNKTSLSVADDNLLIKPINDDTTTALSVQNTGGDEKLIVGTGTIF